MMMFSLNGDSGGTSVGPDPLAHLIVGAAAGDVAMTRELVKSVTPAVRHVVQAVMGRSHPDLADITQEGLMALRGALPSFRSESTVLHFAAQVAVRVAISARRRWRSQERIVQQARLAIAPDAELGPSEDPLEQQERSSAFQSLIHDLPDSQAETFVLRVILDYTLAQVAAATGVSVNTVRSRVRLAKQKLKHRLRTNASLRDQLRP